MKSRTRRIILDVVVSWSVIGVFLYFTNVWLAGLAVAFGCWNYWDGLTRRFLK